MGGVTVDLVRSGPAAREVEQALQEQLAQLKLRAETAETNAQEMASRAADAETRLEVARAELARFQLPGMQKTFPLGPSVTIIFSRHYCCSRPA